MKPLPFGFGFLSIGVIAGLVVGYTVADFVSQSSGYQWSRFPYPRYPEFTARCILIGPAIGLFVGFVMDALFRDIGSKNRAIKAFAWMVLFYAGFYMMFLASAVQAVRE